jgi:hypothetical protein
MEFYEGPKNPTYSVTQIYGPINLVFSFRYCQLDIHFSPQVSKLDSCVYVHTTESYSSQNFILLATVNISQILSMLHLSAITSMFYIITTFAIVDA